MNSMNARILDLTRRRWLQAGAALGLLTLAACSSDPVPRDTFYRLGPPAVPAARAGGPITGVAEVPPFRAAGIVSERAILFRDSPDQLQQYTYHAWAEPPALMLQRSLIGVLRQAQAFGTVATPDMRPDRDYELRGDLRQLEHVRGAGRSTVAMEIELAVRRVRGNQQVLLKTYRAEEPVPDGSVGGAVAAFTRGLDSIYGAFLADLAALPKD